MSQVPWSRIREWKERERKKQFEELMVATRPEATTAAGEPVVEPVKSISERFEVKKFQERIFFGSIVGGVTGAFFGSLDAVNGLKKGEAFGVPLISTSARAKFAFNHVGTAGAIFSGFYGFYQGSKYLVKEIRNEDDYGNAAFALIMAGGPLVLSATFRRNIPYASLLVALDVISDIS